LRAVKVDRDKVRRVNAISGIVESGRCYLPEAAPWVRDLIDECAAFPNAKHDDQVDTLTIALDYMALSTGRWRPL
jgi:predicted phage terminase large subunit-like protein